MLEWIRSKLHARGAARPPLLRHAEAARRDGDLRGARRMCLAALRASPEDAHVLSLMAAIAADERQTEEGLSWARRAVAVDPRSVAAHYALGRLWEGAERYAEAEASYRKVTVLDPNHARAHNNLGCMLHMQGKLDAALACYRKALELDPQQPEANKNYAALAGADAGRLETAIDGFKRQIAANPGDAAAYNSLANIYVELGRHREALVNLERALALDPDRVEFHFAKAHLLLLLGNYAEGWKEYEWRWRMKAINAPALRFSRPMWDGRRIEKGALLIHGETGFGDTLQFVRYAPLAAVRCATVIVECQPALKSLLHGAKGVSQVVAQGERLPPFDTHVPLIALPGIFGTTLDSIPWQGPYIHADPAQASEWRSLVASCEPARIKAGLVWAGNPQNPNDRARSLALQDLAPLARVPDVTFFSLQKGPAAAQAVAPPAGMRLVDLTPRILDFSDTAALLSQLDLVVSIDTAVAHLSGAMGMPTWVALPFAADWRYHVGRGDNPWYPTMRLFRQERDGDWSAVIAQIAQELLLRAESKQTP